MNQIIWIIFGLFTVLDLVKCQSFYNPLYDDTVETYPRQYQSHQSHQYQHPPWNVHDDTIEIIPRQNPLWSWLLGFIPNQRPHDQATTLPPATAPLPSQRPSQRPTNGNKCAQCICGIANKKTRIVGGKETEVNQYPWMAMLLYNLKFYCGATLINDRYVLTAAHCINGFNSDYITVRLLDHNKAMSNPHKIDRKIKKILQHTSYTSVNYNNDIAILHLDEPVKMSDVLRPACLPTSGKSFTGESGIVTGWGATKENGAISDTLQEVTVPIMSNTNCKKTKYGAHRITDNMLCAGFDEGSKDSCQGDSGGPLHVIDGGQHQIVGIVSWGEGCAKANYPGVYSRVNRYGTWIRANTKDACYC